MKFKCTPNCIIYKCQKSKEDQDNLMFKHEIPYEEFILAKTRIENKAIKDNLDEYILSTLK